MCFPCNGDKKQSLSRDCILPGLAGVCSLFSIGGQELPQVPTWCVGTRCEQGLNKPVVLLPFLRQGFSWAAQFWPEIFFLRVSRPKNIQRVESILPKGSRGVGISLPTPSGLSSREKLHGDSGYKVRKIKDVTGRESSTDKSEIQQQ